MNLVLASHRVAVDLRAGRIRGFTLIEVLLATGITAGLLLVALFFHQQSAALRNGLLDESAQLTAVRQIMARLSRELAGLAPEAGLFRGDSRSIEFVWRRPPGTAPDGLGDAVDGLQRVRYESALDEETEETGPLRRNETPIERDAPESVESEPESGSVYAFMEDADGAEDPGGVSGGVSLAGIRFAQFRFWNGEDWTETWGAPEPPLGVEVSLGFLPALETVTAEDYPAELFRRLIPVLATGPVTLDVGGGRSPVPGRETAGSGAPGGGSSAADEAEPAPTRRGRGRL
ncbi:MAG: hypothetical protein H7A45_14560 [Verrucomicrobiales bacterium]|nr:hypothetical protein [Verrucomicrobiales bacterium]MCP5526402.1 hypothetical protein [Verrucomicrobiales bacterium]